VTIWTPGFPGLLDAVLAVRPRILEGVSGMLPD
jgi:hypothetical protein